MAAMPASGRRVTTDAAGRPPRQRPGRGLDVAGCGHAMRRGRLRRSVRSPSRGVVGGRAASRTARRLVAAGAADGGRRAGATPAPAGRPRAARWPQPSTRPGRPWRRVDAIVGVPAATTGAAAAAPRTEPGRGRSPWHPLALGGQVGLERRQRPRVCAARPDPAVAGTAGATMRSLGAAAGDRWLGAWPVTIGVRPSGRAAARAPRPGSSGAARPGPPPARPSRLHGRGAAQRRRRRPVRRRGDRRSSTAGLPGTGGAAPVTGAVAEPRRGARQARASGTGGRPAAGWWRHGLTGGDRSADACGGRRSALDGSRSGVAP